MDSFQGVHQLGRGKYYNLIFTNFNLKFMGQAVAQLVEGLRYKQEGRGFDSRWCHWSFSLT